LALIDGKFNAIIAGLGVVLLLVLREAPLGAHEQWKSDINPKHFFFSFFFFFRAMRMGKKASGHS
jgi:hypothetical protein